MTDVLWRGERLVICLVGMIAVCVGGCRRPAFELVPVSGRITLDGKPAARVTVSFSPRRTATAPRPGPMSEGTTDADGRYELVAARRNAGRGAVPGPHVIAVRGLEDFDELLRMGGYGEAPLETAAPSLPGRNALPNVRIPRRYQEGGLEFDVPPGGTTTADFDLTTQ